MVRQFYERVTASGLKQLLKRVRAANAAKINGRDRLPLVEQAQNDIASDAMTILAGALGVDPRCLRAQDRLAELFRIDVAELGEEAAAIAKLHGLGPQIESGGEELYYGLEKVLTRQQWNRLVLPLRIGKNATDDDWIDRIMELTVREYCELFNGNRV